MAYTKLKTTLVVVTIVIVAVCCLLGYGVVRAITTVRFEEDKTYKVERVIDGDTFDLKVGWHEVTVRMLGVDTPETVDPRKDPQCYGKEASEHTKSVLTGQHVFIKFNPHREQQDRYDRYLAYVYLVDGSFVNEELLREGYAREYTFGKAYSLQREFRDAEAVAKMLGRGLWGECE